MMTESTRDNIVGLSIVHLTLLCFALASAPVFFACDEVGDDSADDETSAEAPQEDDDADDNSDDENAGDRASSDAERDSVVVASTDIAVGTPLSEDSITTRDVPTEYLPTNPLLGSDVHIYLDQPVTADLEEGDMLLTSDFAVADDRALSSRVPAGQRAVPVVFDTGASLTHRIESGDRIDIIGTFDVVSDGVGSDPDGAVTMSLIQNVTVLAPGAGPSADGDASRELTVALTPQETELLTVSASHGNLSFGLRNRDDRDTTPVTRQTLRDTLETLDVIQQERNELVSENPPPCPLGQRRDSSGDCVPDIEITR